MVSPLTIINCLLSIGHVHFLSFHRQSFVSVGQTSLPLLLGFFSLFSVLLSPVFVFYSLLFVPLKQINLLCTENLVWGCLLPISMSSLRLTQLNFHLRSAISALSVMGKYITSQTLYFSVDYESIESMKLYIHFTIHHPTVILKFRFQRISHDGYMCWVS